jgi:hypothetical protein
MFWRRRKLPEDSEPLVPHGLIWQATEDLGSTEGQGSNEDQGSTELPPDMWDNSPSEVKPSPAQPVKMPARVSLETDYQPSQTAPHPGELSPPVKWPRVDDAEIARRAQLVDTAVSFPYRKPLMGAAVPKPVESEYQPESEPARLELVSVSPTTPRRSGRAAQFKNWVSRFRDLKLPNLSLILERARRARIFARLNGSASRSVLAATEGLKLVRERSGPALDAAKLKWIDGSSGALTKSRQGIQRLRQGVRASLMSSPARIWNRARTLRVTIRIPASNWRALTSLAETAKAGAVRARHTLRRDSRLWASLAMGGVSALLALGMISVLRHQGSDKKLLPRPQETVDAATPSPTTQPLPSQPRISAEPTVGKPSPAVDGKPGNHSSAGLAPSVVQKDTPVSPSRAKKHRARHRTEEDDYVAADTYVYYGVGGKPGR